MKIEATKDIVVIIATGGALLLGLGKFVGSVNEVPKQERRIQRLENKMAYVVSGIEKLTRTKYAPQRISEETE